MNSTKRHLLALTLFAILGLAGCMTAPSPQFSARDQMDIQAIESYLNLIACFKADFTQTGSFGPGSGTLWVDRPGRLRIDYAGATARLMVISQGQVNMLDRATYATTTMKLSRTPLAILLTPRITLSGPVSVTSLSRGNDTIQITLDKTSSPGQGSLTLSLTEHPMRLTQVSVTNPYGQILTMQLSNLTPNPSLTPTLFTLPAS